MRARAQAAAPEPGAWASGASIAADAEAAAETVEEPPSEGAVHYKTAPLWQTIRSHYEALGRTMPEYVRRVDLDTFGSLFVEQVGRARDVCVRRRARARLDGAVG